MGEHIEDMRRAVSDYRCSGCACTLARLFRAGGRLLCGRCAPPGAEPAVWADRESWEHLPPLPLHGAQRRDVAHLSDLGECVAALRAGVVATWEGAA